MKIVRCSFILGILLLGLCMNLSPISGARFPNSVPKTFTVSGKTAVEWAKVLGLNPNENRTLLFSLHPMEAHAWSIRQGNPSPESAPSNSIKTDPQSSTLTLSGYWLDQLTGSGRFKKPRYTFGSGFIREDLSGAGPWGDILRNLGFPRSMKAPKSNGEILETRTSATHWFPWTEKLPWLEVKVYQLESFEEANKPNPWGYQVVIGVEE